MSEGSDATNQDPSADTIQNAEGKSLDSLSSGDEFLFNLLYPLAVEVLFVFLNLLSHILIF